jgi:hypothetical protein
MKLKVANRIPGKKAKVPAPEKKTPAPIEEIEKAGEPPPETAGTENRETLDDKIRKSQARKKFEAEVRGKLKYSRKR